MRYGIDFGTSNSVVASWGDGKVDVLQLDAHNLEPEWQLPGFAELFPTVFGMAAGVSAPLFGWAAKLRATDAAYAVKRFLREGGQEEVAGRQYSTSTIAAAIFRSMREGAAHSFVDLTSAVVTVPANSSGQARYRTREAARRGGIRVEALINEPTAAAMSYVHDFPEDQQLLVFDWGGGTLDVTVLEYSGGLFEERISRGVARLGGIDIDKRLEEHLLVELAAEAQSWSPLEWVTFRRDVERTKIRLSYDERVPFLNPSRSRAVEVTRAALESAMEPLLRRMHRPIEDCLEELQIHADEIDAVLMIGGTSQIPLVRRSVEEALGSPPVPNVLVNPMTAVARGAAIASAVLGGELQSELAVVTSNALGTIQMRSGERLFSTIIPRNASLPASGEKSYRPNKDNEQSLSVEVWEGDPDLTVDHEDNVLLTRTQIRFPRPGTRDESRFTLRYSYDTDGIVRVKAVLDSTGQVLLDDEVTEFGENPQAELSDVSDVALDEIFVDATPAPSPAERPESGTFAEAPSPAHPRRRGLSVVVDAPSVVSGAGEAFGGAFAALEAALTSLEETYGQVELKVLVDSSFLSGLAQKEQRRAQQALAEHRLLLPPDGIAREESVAVLGQLLQGLVVSNADFHDQQRAHPWLRESGRILRAGTLDDYWLFEPSTPEAPPEEPGAMPAATGSSTAAAPDGWEQSGWSPSQVG